MKKDNPLRNNPDHLFEDQASSLSRRGFLKRSGGATIATLAAWQLTAAKARAQSAPITTHSIWESESEIRWEYALKCTRSPDDEIGGIPNVARIPDGWLYSGQGDFDHPRVRGKDEGLQIALYAYGPKTDAIGKTFAFSGTAIGQFSGDVDDDTPQKLFTRDRFTGQLEPGFDSGRGDEIAKAEVDGRLSRLKLIDGEMKKCSWAPRSLTVQKKQEHDLTMSIVIKPDVEIIACAALDIAKTSKEFSLEYNPVEGDSGLQGGLNYTVTRPASSRKEEAIVTWEFIVVRRRKGSSDEWKDWGNYSLEPLPSPSGL